MNTNWIVALACGAALALGACISGSPATTPTTPKTPTDPGTPAPAPAPAPDDRTDEQKAADQAMDDARRAVERANSAARSAATNRARDAAQGLIDNARTALNRALALWNAAFEAARGLPTTPSNIVKLDRVSMERDEARAAAALLRAQLDRAEGSIGWSGVSVVATAISRPVVIPRTAIDVERTERIESSADVATRLKAANLPAVMFEAGKNVMQDGQSSSGDRLRMRGIPVRYTHAGSGVLRHPNGAAVAAGSSHNILAGLTITRSGLAIDLGGDGRQPGSDLRITLNAAGEIGSGTANAYDLALDFGRPASSPTGNAEHYWAADLMPTAAQVTADETDFKNGTRTLALGTYYLRMSNHLGFDSKLEYPEPDAAPYPIDDVNYYLSYAAYGLFDFLPRSNGAGDEIPGQGRARAGRIFPFHVGYDAFKDAAGKKVTDVADADKITRGKFTGRTIAQELVANEPYPYDVKPPAITTDAVLLRGDVELTATISGTAASNKISGKIKNLESWDTRGHWEDYARITGDVMLSEGDIAANGSFTGVVADPDGSATAFAAGAYRGSFYGPLSGLEAAGAYLINYDPAGSVERSIVGGFGAALVREDGTYGNEVETGRTGN